MFEAHLRHDACCPFYLLEKALASLEETQGHR